jgi:hypothetical protein
VSTAGRYAQKAIALLAETVDDLTAAVQRIRRLAYAILDGTLIPIDRVADQKPSRPPRCELLARRSDEASWEVSRVGSLWSGPARLVRLRYFAAVRGP